MDMDVATNYIKGSFIGKVKMINKKRMAMAVIMIMIVTMTMAVIMPMMRIMMRVVMMTLTLSMSLLLRTMDMDVATNCSLQRDKHTGDFCSSLCFVRNSKTYP
jgi:flagellar biosynthesis component FlhA